MKSYTYKQHSTDSAGCIYEFMHVAMQIREIRSHAFEKE